jgi:hypothetical protein
MCLSQKRTDTLPLGESNEFFFAEFGDMTEYEGLTFEERVLSSSSQTEIQQRRYEEMGQQSTSRAAGFTR